MTVQIRDSDGTVRLSGDLLAAGGATGDVLTRQADGTYAPAVGGSPAVTTRGAFEGYVLAAPIADNGIADLSFRSDLNLPGGPVVDRTDPFLPAVLAAGDYTVSCYVEPVDPMTADGFFHLTLILDNGGVAVEMSNESRLATAARPLPGCFISNTYFIPNAGTIRLRCRNRDGAAAIVFAITNATIQRVQ